VAHLVRLTSGVLVGRDEDLAAALAAVRGLQDGRPGVLTVSGPAGIGKTRFVTTLADRLRAEGKRVLSGACLDFGAGTQPYAALIAAFRSGDPPAVQLLDALTGAVDMRRSRLFELLRTTTAALARRRPTVLVIEDVHWSDRITRDALLYLTVMAREGRWALVVTFRDDEVAARPAVQEFLDALNHDAVLHVKLDALSRQDVTALMEGIVGERPAQQDAERVYRRSGGVPLLVEEVVAAETAGMTGVPNHLRDMFLARLQSLGEPAVGAASVVAVMGDRCDERLVADVLELDTDHGGGGFGPRRGSRDSAHRWRGVPDAPRTLARRGLRQPLGRAASSAAPAHRRVVGSRQASGCGRAGPPLVRRAGTGTGGAREPRGSHFGRTATRARRGIHLPGTSARTL
jgi:hypothetical protein